MSLSFPPLFQIGKPTKIFLIEKYKVPGKFLVLFQASFSQGQLTFCIVSSAWSSLVLVIIQRNQLTTQHICQYLNVLLPSMVALVVGF